MSEELFRKLSLRAVRNIEKPRPLKMAPCFSDHEIPVCHEGKALFVLKGKDVAILNEAKEVLELHFSNKKANNSSRQESVKNDSGILKSQLIATEIVNGREENNNVTLEEIKNEEKTTFLHPQSMRMMSKTSMDVLDVPLHRQKFAKYTEMKDQREAPKNYQRSHQK